MRKPEPVTTSGHSGSIADQVRLALQLNGTLHRRGLDEQAQALEFVAHSSARLLEAFKRLRDIVVWGDDFDSEGRARFDAVVQEADSAIAEAEGEKPLGLK